MRTLALIGVILSGCGPDLIPHASGSYLELARQMPPPPASRTEGLVHFRGETIAEAEVTLVLRNNERVTTFTDQHGHYAIELPSHQVSLIIARADQWLGMLEPDSSRDALDVELRVPWKVKGVVRDEKGAPVSGALVGGSAAQFTCMGAYGYRPPYWFATGDDGSFVLELPSPAAWISATSFGRTVGDWPNLFGAEEWTELNLQLPAEPAESRLSLEAVDPPRDSTIDLDEEPAPSERSEIDPDEKVFRVAFRSVDESGAPVSGLLQQGGPTTSEEVVSSVRWSPRHAWLPPMITFSRRGYLTSWFEIDPLQPPSSIGDVALEQARGLTVNVLDEEGRPISGCRLWSNEGDSTMTDASGAAWITVGRGPITLSPMRCCKGERVEVPAGLDEATIRVRRDIDTCNRGPTG